MFTVNNQNQTKIRALLLGLVNLVPYKKETLLLSFRRGTLIHWSKCFEKRFSLNLFKFLKTFVNFCRLDTKNGIEVFSPVFDGLQLK